MIFIKKNSNAILPIPSTDCFDKRCLNLYANKNISLPPLQVTEVDFDLMINIPKGFIVKIVNHQNNNPWIAITSSIYNNTDHNEIELKISVMSSIEHTLKRNDIVCHFQLLQLEDYFMQKKGKYSFLKFIYIYIYPLILSFVILAQSEEIYYSDEDDDDDNDDNDADDANDDNEAIKNNIDKSEKISDKCYEDYNNEEIDDEDNEAINEAFDEAIANNDYIKKMKEISDKCFDNNNEKIDNQIISDYVQEIPDGINDENKNNISMYEYLKLGNLIHKRLFKQKSSMHD
jgi:hypothetical protein